MYHYRHSSSMICGLTIPFYATARIDHSPSCEASHLCPTIWLNIWRWIRGTRWRIYRSCALLTGHLNRTREISCSRESVWLFDPTQSTVPVPCVRRRLSFKLPVCTGNSSKQMPRYPLGFHPPSGLRTDGDFSRLREDLIELLCCQPALLLYLSKKVAEQCNRYLISSFPVYRQSS